MAEKWIQKAVPPAKSKQKIFTKKAEKAGKTVKEEAKNVLKPDSGASTKTKREAVFAENMQKIAKKPKTKMTSCKAKGDCK